MEKVGEHFERCLGLVARDHVASVSHSGKGEIVLGIHSDVPGHLPIRFPGMPRLHFGEMQRLDPTLGAWTNAGMRIEVPKYWIPGCVVPKLVLGRLGGQETTRKQVKKLGKRPTNVRHALVCIA